jgi:hypothetical protein
MVAGCVGTASPAVPAAVRSLSLVGVVAARIEGYALC